VYHVKQLSVKLLILLIKFHEGGFTGNNINFVYPLKTPPTKTTTTSFFDNHSHFCLQYFFWSP
jgi:hypothetical protein